LSQAIEADVAKRNFEVLLRVEGRTDPSDTTKPLEIKTYRNAEVNGKDFETWFEMVELPFFRVKVQKFDKEIFRKVFKFKTENVTDAWVCNCSLLEDIVPGFFEYLKEHTDFSDFTNSAKKLSIALKSHPLSSLSAIQRACIECENLQGFGTYTIDPIVEAKRFAAGSNYPPFNELERPEAWKRGFTSALDKLYSDAKPEFMTFKEFVLSRKWASEGALGWKKKFYLSGKRVRLNKAAACWFMSDQELLDIAMDTKSFRATSFVKNEPSKARLVVGGPLNLYLNECYLVYFLNSCYTKWPGVTLDQNKREEMRQKFKFIRLRKGKWTIDTDFKSFEAQQKQWEMVAMRSKLYQIAVANGMSPDVAERIESGYNRLAYDVGGEMIYSQDSGVPSGTRLTSILGNMFNCLTNLVLNSLIGSVSEFQVRGDDGDSVGSKLNCQEFWYNGLGCGIYYSALKSIISPTDSEFLRIRSNDSESIGYASRSIIKVFQRSSWSADISELNWAVEGFKALSTSCRRLGLPSKLYSWCRNNQVLATYHFEDVFSSCRLGPFKEELALPVSAVERLETSICSELEISPDDVTRSMARDQLDSAVRAKMPMKYMKRTELWFRHKPAPFTVSPESLFSVKSMLDRPPELLQFYRPMFRGNQLALQYALRKFKNRKEAFTSLGYGNQWLYLGKLSGSIKEEILTKGLTFDASITAPLLTPFVNSCFTEFVLRNSKHIQNNDNLHYARNVFRDRLYPSILASLGKWFQI